MHGANMKIAVSMSVSVALLKPHVLPRYRNENSCEFCLIFILRRYGMTDETKSIQCKYGLQETRGVFFSTCGRYFLSCSEEMGCGLTCCLPEEQWSIALV